jgi:hypothetical protein
MPAFASAISVGIWNGARGCAAAMAAPHSSQMAIAYLMESKIKIAVGLWLVLPSTNGDFAP